jgi:hypothetical protein
MERKNLSVLASQTLHHGCAWLVNEKIGAFNRILYSRICCRILGVYTPSGFISEPLNSRVCNARHGWENTPTLVRCLTLHHVPTRRSAAKPVFRRKTTEGFGVSGDTNREVCNTKGSSVPTILPRYRLECGNEERRVVVRPKCISRAPAKECGKRIIVLRKAVALTTITIIRGDCY